MDALSLQQQKALDKLESWLDNGRVAALTGFPGAGKTEVSRQLQGLAPKHGLKVVEVEAPGDGAAGLDDVMEHVAAQAGVEAFAHVPPTDRLQQLNRLLSDPVLLIIEEAHRLLTADGKLDPRLAQVVRDLARPGRGRLLFVSSRALEATKETDRIVQVPLGSMTTHEAINLLEQALTREIRLEAIPSWRRAEVVRRLGYNPRAIHYLVAALRRASLDALLGPHSEDWQAIEAHIAAELVEQLERDFLAQIVADLDSETSSWLRALSVLRQAIFETDLRRLAPSDTAHVRMRTALVDRHLLDHRQGRYRVEPLAREAALARLAQDQEEHKAAHRRAAGIFTPHFTGRNVVAGHEHDFVEARYHLALAGDTKTLGEVAQRFVGYLANEIKWATPRPRGNEQRDVRILTLAALLDIGVKGPGSLWFHLAKLLVERAQGNDLRLARVAAQKPCGSRATPEAWLLHLRLEAEAGVPAPRLERIAQRGFGHHPDSAELYVSAARFLALAGAPEKSLVLLQEGLKKVPADKNLFALYQLYGELLARKGEVDRAMALLQQGKRKIPADKNLFALYQLEGELLARKGDVDGALALYQTGIEKIAATSGGSKLAESAAFLSLATGAPDTIRKLQQTLKSKNKYTWQISLCEVVLAEAENRWQDAVNLAAKWRDLADPYAPLVCHHALALIATNRPMEALDVLDESALRTHKFPDTPIWAWLEALAAAWANNDTRAAAAVARLSAEGRPAPTVKSLITWWARPRNVAEQHPSYAFPLLPPGCTGHSTVLISPPDGTGGRPEVVLPSRSETMVRPSMPPATPPTWLSRTPWDAKLIDQVFTPGDRSGVHVLGSFDRRITFFNQQVRALLSVRSMHNLGRLKAGTRVAVIGGGAAGVTAALSAHLLDAEAYLYESQSLLLPRQRTADHRWLHPHVYDWPERPMSEDRALLPILDWKAGRASDVVDAIDRQFRARFPSERIYCNREVVHIEGNGKQGFTLFFSAGPEAEVDIVIMAVGFGADGATRQPAVHGDTTPSYWDPDTLGKCVGQQIIIGGAGDGGLIDAMRVAIGGFQHHITLREILDHKEGLHLAEAMLDVDRAAREETQRTGTPPKDLFNRYLSQIKPSDRLLERIRSLPTNARAVSLVSSTPGLLRLETALVNRLMVFLLERAGRIALRGGQASLQPDGTCIIVPKGGREIKLPDARLVLRRGPDPSYLGKMLPEAAKWLVPVDLRVEALELTRNLDFETWRFWHARANP